MSKRTRRGDVPSFRAKRPVPIHEIPPPPELTAQVLNRANSYLRTYLMGDCSVVVTREWGEWHLSVSCKDRYPTWLEISRAWYRVIPDAAEITGALVLPPLAQYVNLHEFCMQVVQIPTREDP